MAIFDNAATSQRSRESFFRCSREDSVQGGRGVSWVELDSTSVYEIYMYIFVFTISKGFVLIIITMIIFIIMFEHMHML